MVPNFSRMKIQPGVKLFLRNTTDAGSGMQALMGI